HPRTAASAQPHTPRTAGRSGPPADPAASPDTPGLTDVAGVHPELAVHRPRHRLDRLLESYLLCRRPRRPLVVVDGRERPPARPLAQLRHDRRPVVRVHPAPAMAAG